MEINKLTFLDKSLHNGHIASRERLRENSAMQNSNANVNYGPARQQSFSGSERLSQNHNKYSNDALSPKAQNISFTGDPKNVTRIVQQFLSDGSKMQVSNWAQKAGGANWLDKLLKSVNKNEALYEAFVALIVAGVLKPICVLAMPGAEKEDKQMSAAKNTVSAGLGFVLSNLILTPCSTAVNKIITSLDSANPTQYIKDIDYVNALKNEELLPNMKSTLGDAFKTTYKKLPDLGVSPLKGKITIALTPLLLKFMLDKSKKSKEPANKEKMLAMSSIKADSTKSKLENSSSPDAGVSFTGKVPDVIVLAEEAKKQNLFSKIKGGYDNLLAKPIAKGIGWFANSKAGKKLVNFSAHFNKPSARWADLASVAVTYSYVSNTAKSDKIEEDRKLPLMINNVMVTAASSTAALLIDKFTDKPMNELLKGYLKSNEAELLTKSNQNIKQTLKTALETFDKGGENINLEGLTKHADELVESAKGVFSENMKTAIEALKNDETIKEAARKGLIKNDNEYLTKIALSGFEKQASKIFGNISKAKSLTIFVFTVRFLVTVLMTPVIGRVVAIVNKKLGREPKNKKETAPDNSTIGMPDFLNSISKNTDKTGSV